MENINRTQWTVMKAELGLLIELTVQCFGLVFAVDPCFSERHTAENFPGIPVCPGPFLLTRAEAEASLFPLGSATAAAILTLLNWTAGILTN